MAAPDTSSLKYYKGRFEALKQERTTFDEHWKELSRYMAPRRGRFITSDRNKGERVWKEIVNSAGAQAYKVFRNGMLSGVMSPTRQWFELGVDDPRLMESQAVKVWLQEVTAQITRVFNQSNLYNMAPVFLGELGLYGTSAMSHEDDFDTVARFYTHTAGSYIIAQNDKYQVDTFGRHFEMTTIQLIKKFGIENVSQPIRRAYDSGTYEAWWPIYHLIEPNPDYDPTRKTNGFKKFRSCYFEPGANIGSSSDKFLSKSGFSRFPVYVGRWETTAEDIYGTDCPGMLSLGDVKMLQQQEKELARSIRLQNLPAFRGPASLAAKDIDLQSGNVTLYDTDTGQNQLQPVYQPNADVNSMALDIRRTEGRIAQAWYNDLFLAITQMEGVQPRNQLELSQRNQERLLQLGPVLERLHNEFLTPMVDRTFDRLVEISTDQNGNWLDRSVIPKPPPELEGRDIAPKYISSIAIAQRAAGTGPIEQGLAFVAGLIGSGLSDGLKIDGDQAIDEHLSRIGTPARIVRPDEEVAKMREERQQMAQAAQMAEVAATGAKAGKDLMQAQAAGQPQGGRR